MKRVLALLPAAVLGACGSFGGDRAGDSNGNDAGTTDATVVTPLADAGPASDGGDGGGVVAPANALVVQAAPYTSPPAGGVSFKLSFGSATREGNLPMLAIAAQFADAAKDSPSAVIGFDATATPLGWIELASSKQKTVLSVWIPNERRPLNEVVVTWGRAPDEQVLLLMELDVSLFRIKDTATAGNAELATPPLSSPQNGARSAILGFVAGISTSAPAAGPTNEFIPLHPPLEQAGTVLLSASRIVTDTEDYATAWQMGGPVKSDAISLLFDAR